MVSIHLGCLNPLKITAELKVYVGISPVEVRNQITQGDIQVHKSVLMHEGSVLYGRLVKMGPE